MTKVTFRNGKPVMRDSKVGTGQACCCGGCHRCMIAGQRDCRYITEESCEECERQCFEVVQTECSGECPDGYQPDADYPPSISITVDSCWSPDSYSAEVDVAIGCGVILSATITSQYGTLAKLGRVAPTVTAAPTDAWYCTQGGSGAALSVTLEQGTDYCGFPFWYVASVAVIDGGSGYSLDCALVGFSVASGDTELSSAYAVIGEVDEDGAIVSVVVFSGGEYYRLDTSATPIVATPTITVDDHGYGSGAVIVPVIDTNTSSPTFGKITSLTIQDGGSGYRSVCYRTRAVASCDDCPTREEPEIGFCTSQGVCGSWETGPCEPCLCDVASSCPSPTVQNPCENIFPDYPWDCCSGECKQWQCYPGAKITIHFRKKVGCVDPNGILAGINEGEEFDVVFSGGYLQCQETGQFSGAPCQTEWTLSTGCVVSDFSFQPIGDGYSQQCETCYEFLGWESCRNDCSGNCA